MTAPLPYLVIIFKGNELENVFLSDTQNFVNTLTADDRYSLPNTDNLKQLIQMQLYQKRKAFSRYDGLLKTWLDICRKSLISEDRLTGNMVNRPKHCWNMNDSTVTIFSDQFQGKCV